MLSSDSWRCMRKFGWNRSQFRETIVFSCKSRFKPQQKSRARTEKIENTSPEFWDWRKMYLIQRDACQFTQQHSRDLRSKSSQKMFFWCANPWNSGWSWPWLYDLRVNKHRGNSQGNDLGPCCKTTLLKKAVMSLQRSELVAVKSCRVRLTSRLSPLKTKAWLDRLPYPDRHSVSQYWFFIKSKTMSLKRVFTEVSTKSPFEGQEKHPTINSNLNTLLRSTCYL